MPYLYICYTCSKKKICTLHRLSRELQSKIHSQAIYKNNANKFELVIIALTPLTRRTFHSEVCLFQVGRNIVGHTQIVGVEVVQTNESVDK